jgi:hypothetical protein
MHVQLMTAVGQPGLESTSEAAIAPDETAADHITNRIEAAEAALDSGDLSKAREQIRGLRRANVRDAELRRRLNAAQRTVLDGRPWKGRSLETSRETMTGSPEGRRNPQRQARSGPTTDAAKWACLAIVAFSILGALTKLPWRCTFCGVWKTYRSRRYRWKRNGKRHSVCANCNGRMERELSKQAWQSQ